jgi:methionine synthase I (cobalamin-dependent)/5,10-methylenetetrahydrofolate reductase
MSMSKHFLTHLAERPLLADGAMGTMLYARGFDFSVCYDALNLSQPEVVLDIHRQYAAAGAEVLETNTFGANAVRLANWNLEGSVTAIAARGVALARQGAREAGRDAYIAGAVGPLGVNLAPLGSLSADQAYAVFREQITALAEAGAHLLILETFSDLTEIALALRAARDVCDLPIVALMTFNRDQRTLMGITPQQAAHALIAHRPALIGANCSTGPRGVLEVVQGMADALAGDAEGPALAAVPNAGFPEARGARLFYPATPDYFADYARRFVQAGARLVGGCCGTTPAHIRAMRAALDALARPAAKHVHAAVVRRAERQSPPLDDTRFPTTLAQALAEGEFVVTVEVEPPKGADTAEVEETARMLKEAGATVLDISDMPMARMRMTGLAAAYRVQAGADIETVLHFPVRGRNLLRIQGDLLAAHALGIRNVFVTMGDPTRIGDYPQANDSHDIVPTGLVQMIKERLNTGQDGLGQPIGRPCAFFVGVAANLTPEDFEKEAKLLKKKIDSGADFALTQPVFDPQLARAFLDYYQQTYGALNLPILVGILPLASVGHAQFLRNEVPGMVVPDQIIQRLSSVGNKTRTEGMRIALETLEALRDVVQGAYFIPAFGRYDIIARLIEQVRASQGTHTTARR